MYVARLFGKESPVLKVPSKQKFVNEKVLF